jgi:hypothetical protein
MSHSGHCARSHKERPELATARTHLGPHDSCWLWALAACGDDPGWGEDVVDCEVVVLKQCFWEVHNLAKQKWGNGAD